MRCCEYCSTELGKTIKAVVIEEHISKYPFPIKVKKADMVALGAKDDEFPGWIFVTVKCGKQGWAPVQYIQKSSCGLYGYFINDYDAYELNTVAGEELSILYELNYWYKVAREDCVEGWVPVRTVMLRE